MVSDLRDEARQAHEDDRENPMMIWEIWLRTDHRAACKWRQGVDNQRDDGAQPTWSHFEAAFGEHIPASCDRDVDELSVQKDEECKCTRSSRVESSGVAGLELLCELWRNE